MYQMIYTSEATEAFSPEELRNLLAAARTTNKIHGVTGMLVYCDNQFLQALEGNPAAVISTYDRIVRDPRHGDLMVLHRGYSHVGKMFSESSMGFHSLALKDELPAGFVRENDRLRVYQFDGLMAMDFLLACRSQPSLTSTD